MTNLTNDQEIRAKAIEIKLTACARITSACIIKGAVYDASGIWSDGDLEEICEYIRSGKKASS